ncbi:MAG: hypothetical protein Q4D21_01310 [Phascolarctobacterium sp.]|nr:hypothetical protein [Phascolarctobacterium sp.]
MKKIAFVLAALFLTSQFGFANSVMAHPDEGSIPPKISDEKGNPSKMKMRGPRRPRLTKEQIVEKVSKDYGYSVEILSPLADKYSPMDLGTSCLYAKASGEDLEKVLELRQNNSWTRMRKLLFKDAQDYADKMQAYQVGKFKAKENLTKEELEKFLAKGYPMNDIVKASQVAAKAKQPVAKVLPMRTAAFDWEVVEKKLGVWEEPKEQNPWNRRRGGGIRRGAGFSGLHMGEKSQQELVAILHDDYLFSEAELAQYIGKLGFNELENVCLVAYMAQTPLSKVEKMRNKYSWEMIKNKLGLTPNVYEERCIDYQARRLNERMDIPEQLTKDLMYEGFGMHHINTAFLLSKYCDKSIKEILLTKTPAKPWKQVAEELGISQEDLKISQGKISKAFGRH